MRIRVLQSVPLLSSIPEETLSELGNRMRVQEFEDGEYIIRQGEEGSRFYIINEGEVVCTLTNQATREEKELVRLYPQEYFGERALIKKEPRKANVIAIGDVECLILDSNDFQELLASVHQQVETIIEHRESNTKDILNKSEESKRQQQQQSSTRSNEEERKSDGGTGGGGSSLDHIPFDELNVLHTIGTGTFGRVKLAQHKGSGRVCALKFMMKSQIVESRQERNVVYEKNLLMESSNHPFILSLISTYNTQDEIMLLFEFVQGGELWSYIYDREDCIPSGPFGGFTEEAAVFYGAVVTEALSHVHSLGIAYRDLKPENLMLDQMGYLKVIDFGFAKKIPHYVNGTLYRKSFTVCGTPEYLAPELVLSKGHDKGVDHWALGCLIYELLVGTTPFADDRQQNTFRKIVNCKKYLVFPEGVDRSFKELCTSLLEPEPSFRLGSLNGGDQDIKSHPFFRTIDWEALMSRSIQAPYRPSINNPLDTSNFDYFEDEDDVVPYYGDQSLFIEF
jgi:cGMP-dependent protein kinase